MVGSVVDAEDVVQEALVKAIEAFPGGTVIADIEAWLFRIIHNTALDFLRRRARQQRISGEDDMTMIADPIDEVHQRQAAAAGLRTFMRLPVAQRSSVILMDVLGYSLEEISSIIGNSVPAVKAALASRARAPTRYATGAGRRSTADTQPSRTRAALDLCGASTHATLMQSETYWPRMCASIS
jgi:RNA polymerase sigma factor (sigma-70 family)